MRRLLNNRKFRLRLALIAALFALVLAARWGEFTWWGLVPALLGVGLRLWGLGHLEKDHDLTTSGPYRYVRNPLYLGNLLLAAGACIIVGIWWLVALSLVLLAAAYHYAVLREEKALTARFGQEYLDYCQLTPRWLPRLRPAVGTAGKRFSWRLALDNNWHHILVLLVAWVVLVDLMKDVIYPWLFLGSSPVSGLHRMKDSLILFVQGRL